MDETHSARAERRRDDVAALLARAQSGDPRDPALVAALDAALERPASQMDPVQRVNLWARRCWAHHVAGARDVALRCAQHCHDEVRGRSPLAEGMACANLGAAFANQGRAMESVLASHRAVRILSGVPGADVAGALVTLAMGYAHFAAWPLFHETARTLAEMRSNMRPARIAHVDLQLAQFAAEEAQQAGDHEATLDAVDRVERLLGDAARSTRSVAWSAAFRCTTYLEQAKLGAAEAQAALAVEVSDGQPYVRVLSLEVAARSRAACGDLDGARAVCGEALATLREHAAAIGHEPVRRLAAHLGELLLDACGDAAAAERCFDAAADAHLARVRELEEAFARLAVLRDVTAAELRVLSDCREHALRAADHDRESVRNALARAARRGGGEFLASIVARQGLVSICAWCGFVRTGDRAWSPVGDYLPPVEHATHGLCDACLVGVVAEVERAAGRPVSVHPHGDAASGAGAGRCGS